jgi:tyrosyl-tRNA synthetase
MKKAWCPERVVEMNPVLEIVKYVIFHEKKAFEIERPAKFGGRVTYESFQELAKNYAEGRLHPQDLKNGVSYELAEILEPVRTYFENHREANECLETVRKAKVTR